MKITVLGCGSLGKLWLSALSCQGHNVQGWLRVAQSICTINIINPQGQEINFNLPANNAIHLATSNLLLVTVKAWQVSTAILPLLPILAADCAILMLHNGLGTSEELPDIIQPLITGITTHAAYNEGNKIYHVHTGVTHIGPNNKQAEKFRAIANILHQAMPKVIWHDNIDAFSWLKLAINCVINPLTVIYNCRNGELNQHKEEINVICREVAMVMNHEGFHINYENLIFCTKKIICNTADNISSMLQDIRNHRYSEIDYLNGHILRCAQVHGLKVPENQLLFDSVKHKEKNFKK